MVNGILGFIVNLIRSIPFVILLVALLPLTQLITGTTIGPFAHQFHYRLQLFLSSQVSGKFFTRN